MSTSELIARVVPEKKDGPALTPSEVDAIVEIAYLTIAADRRLDVEEIAAFRGVIERLRGERIPDGALDAVLDEMYGRLPAGLRWQITPTVLEEMMRDKDPARSKRVSDAMMKMVKLDIAALQAAFTGTAGRRDPIR